MTRNTLKSALGALILFAAGAAQAYEVEVRDENDYADAGMLEARVRQAGLDAGVDIPSGNANEIKVYVYSSARPRVNSPTDTLYVHRIQLRKRMDGRAPYPFRGWASIMTQEWYGVGTEKDVQERFDFVAGEFFRMLKTVDPATQSPP